jgi:hypothetical protein
VKIYWDILATVLGCCLPDNSSQRSALRVDGCDRTANRIQVLQRDGTYVKETFLSKNTLGAGAVWDVDFSRDPQQQFLYTNDGMNNRISILLRAALQFVTQFGQGGQVPGTFYGAHNVATDSKGNIYTTDTWGGKRVQKFVYKGIGAVGPVNSVR